MHIYLLQEKCPLRREPASNRASHKGRYIFQRWWLHRHRSNCLQLQLQEGKKPADKRFLFRFFHRLCWHRSSVFEQCQEVLWTKWQRLPFHQAQNRIYPLWQILHLKDRVFRQAPWHCWRQVRFCPRRQHGTPDTAVRWSKWQDRNRSRHQAPCRENTRRCQ